VSGYQEGKKGEKGKRKKRGWGGKTQLGDLFSLLTTSSRAGLEKRGLTGMGKRKREGGDINERKVGNSDG